MVSIIMLWASKGFKLLKYEISPPLPPVRFHIKIQISTFPREMERSRNIPTEQHLAGLSCLV